jgi:hypothetical protein
LVAAVLLVVADLSEISYRTIGIGACVDRQGTGVCTTQGHESHAWALVILTPFVLVMAWGAVIGRSRAAAFALVSIGATVLVIALGIDLPKLDDKRGLETLYDDVVGHTGTAFKVELVAGVLLILSGGLSLMRERAGARIEAANARRAERRKARESAELTAMPPPEPKQPPPDAPPPQV